MTVAVEQNYIIYTADGTLNTFTFNFTPIKPENVLVYLYDLSNVKTQLTYQTDYSVTINSDGVGGSVTLVNTPASGYKILIQRYVDYDQETVYPENSPFPSKSHEKALDKLTILTQQLKDKVDRSIYRDEIVDITDFKGARIINIANAVDSNDALNKGQLLSEIQAVDGSGSGIDADMLDGKQATDFVANDDNVVLNMVKNVDGLYSGLDADLVRGKSIPSPIPANKWLGSDASGNYNWKDIVTKDNKVVSQATSPDTTFDIDAGYNVGDVVINTTTNKIYVCVDNTSSAAEWVQTAELSASEILDKIKTVDGAGSGLDADLLQGIDGSNYFYNSKIASFIIQLYTGNGTVNIDWTKGNYAQITLTADTTLTFTNPSNACTLNLLVEQDSTGGWTLALPTITWVLNIAPTLSTGANNKALIILQWTGSEYLGNYVEFQ